MISYIDKKYCFSRPGILAENENWPSFKLLIIKFLNEQIANLNISDFLKINLINMIINKISLLNFNKAFGDLGLNLVEKFNGNLGMVIVENSLIIQIFNDLLKNWDIKLDSFLSAQKSTILNVDTESFNDSVNPKSVDDSINFGDSLEKVDYAKISNNAFVSQNSTTKNINDSINKNFESVIECLKNFKIHIDKAIDKAIKFYKLPLYGGGMWH